MTRDLVATATAALLPLFLLALTALTAGLAALIARHIRDKRYGAAVTLLAYGAAGVVADFAQHVVTDLKDPARPGTWNRVTAASVKLQAVALLRSLFPLAVALVTSVLREPSRVDALLGTLLERAVVDLKTRGVSPVSIGARDIRELTVQVDAGPPAPAPEAPVASPGEPTPKLAGQSGRASVGVMLLTLALVGVSSIALA